MVQFGVHFGNSVLDNSNYDKISNSLTKTSHTWEQGGAHLRITFGIYWWTFKNHKNQTSSFYTCVPKTTVKWGTVKDIRSETKFLSFWIIFCPFNLLSPNSPENQNFEEIKKTFGDVFILSLCNKKHHLLMYAYSDMEWSHRYNFFFSFQTSFCSFAPLLIPKIKILSFYTCAPLIKIIGTPDIWCMLPEK